MHNGLLYIYSIMCDTATLFFLQNTINHQICRLQYSHPHISYKSHTRLVLLVLTRHEYDTVLILGQKIKT